MATIKKGTYRFNDVLSGDIGHLSQEVAFQFEGSWMVSEDEAQELNAFAEITEGDWQEVTAGVYDLTIYCSWMGGTDTVWFGYQYDSAQCVPENNFIALISAINSNNAGSNTGLYGGSWENEDAQTITIPNDSEVSDEFYTWFTANAVEVVEDKPVATVTYNGSIIAALNGGQTKKLLTGGKYLEGDLTVEAAEGGGECDTIFPIILTENGVYNTEYKIADEIWDSNTEYTGSIALDSITTLRFKKVEHLAVPYDLRELEDDKYTLSVLLDYTYDYEEFSSPLNAVVVGFTIIDGVVARIGEYGVLWVKQAAPLNEQYGIDFLEDNTVYITDYLIQAFSWSLSADSPDYVKLTLRAPSKTPDGFMPVTVSVPNKALCGKYKFNTYTENGVTMLDMPFSGKYNQTFKTDFTCIVNGVNKQIIGVHYNFSINAGGISLTFIDIDNNEIFVAGSPYSTEWHGNVSTVIDFGNTPQIVNDLFYELITSITTPQTPVLEELTITENGEYTPSEGCDGFSKVTANVAGGGGECDLPHVIEVDVLPTENISETDVYLCDGKYYKSVDEMADTILVESGQAVSLLQYYGSMGITVGVFTIPTKTTEGVLISDMLTKIYAYYIEDEDDVFAFTANGWFSVADALGSTYNGTITSITEATADGYYALMQRVWRAYVFPEGTVEVEANGYFDVTGKANVVVSVPTIYTVQNASDLQADAPVGSLAYVWKG